MNKHKCYLLKLLVIVWSLIQAFLLTGCAAQTGDRTTKEVYTIGLVMKSRDSEYWMSVASGAEKAARDFDVSVLIVSPDKETNEKLQNKMIKDLIEKGVNALAISPIQSYIADDYLNEAREKHIFLVACDTKIVNDDIPYIGIDNYKAGQELAAEMEQHLGGEGSVGIVSGDLKQTTHAERMEGFLDYIEQKTDMEVAFVESGYSNLLMPEKKIAKLMSDYPDVKGIFSTSAVTALGLATYLETDNVQIMTVDAQQDALEAVETGKISALAAQSGYEIGYQTIQYIAEYRMDTENLLDKILPSEIVTKDNLKKWETDNRFD